MKEQGAPAISDVQTLMALRGLRQRLEAVEAAACEPIAIVGMACRFPGGADTLEEYWKLLVEGRDAVIEIPRERMNLDAFYNPRPQMPGKTYSRSAGLLDGPDLFDPEHFGISPREAVHMDPQQRLLLEVSWEALENAAIDPKSLAGGDAGVFVGISGSEYAQFLQKRLLPEQWAAYMLQGSALNATAGRLSYFYGLNGPSMAIDTACSSSLVAIDRACRSLREGETQLALAAGVNFLAAPEQLIIGSQWGMLSLSGFVRAFDVGADGFVRGEGCGVVVLKRLGEAERSGDRILGLILGSAVNQDGASSGLTVPNGLAQQSLLRAAHRRAGVEPWEVGYVEAHGTGTPLGDPIEAEALGAVFGTGRRREGKLLLGSVKTNVGHLESAAGVAGLMKVVLGLGQEVIPGQLHWQAPSGHVRWQDLPLEVVTAVRPWEPIAGRRIAGVSSFGFSGTNAHVVVEQWRGPAAEAVEYAPVAEVLVISARTGDLLRSLVERYAAFLEGTAERWSDVCWTSAVGRAVWGERLAVAALGTVEAAAQLRSWLADASGSGVYAGRVNAGHRAGAGMDAGADTTSVAEGFVQGRWVDWAARAAGRGLRRVALPTYVFERERYWVESAKLPEPGLLASGVAATGGAMLGSRLRSAGVLAQYETVLAAAGWVGEHRVQDRVVLPATGHLELMLEAGAACLGPDRGLEDVVLELPLTIEETRRVQTVVEEDVEGRHRVRVYAEQASGETGESAWTRVSEGWLVGQGAPPAASDLAAVRSRLAECAAGEAFYAGMAERGLAFGPRFRGVARAWSGAGEALAEVVTTGPAGPGWRLEPWWLDACLQAAALAGSLDPEPAGTLYLPSSLGRLERYAPVTAPCFSHAVLQRIDPNTLDATLTLTTLHGQPIATLQQLRFRKITPKHSVQAYAVEWIAAVSQSKQTDLKGHWVLLVGEDGLSTGLFAALHDGGAICSVLSRKAKSYVNPGDTYLSIDNDLEESRALLRAVVNARGPIDGVLDLRPTVIGNYPLLDEKRAPQELTQILEGSLSLLQALLLEQIQPARGVWLVTRQAKSGSVLSISEAGRALQALRRTAVLEFPELAIHTLDVDREVNVAVVTRVLASGETEEAMVRGDRSYIPKLVPCTPAPLLENQELLLSESGLIEDLQSVPVERRVPGEDEVEIAVHVHGVNFRDVMNALGMLPGTLQRLGAECAGVVVRAGQKSGFKVGDRLFAFAPASFRKFVTVSSAYTQRVPDGFSLAQAAAMPVAYLTALYGLNRLAKLQRGESVLIHSAAGGLGLAAVKIAQAKGAKIYATAGNKEKRDYLRSLGVQHVLVSRTVEFAAEIARLTEGRGVDVVLNSLTGTLAEKTLKVLAHGGRFLEVGKRDVLSREVIRKLRPDVDYFIYDLGTEASNDLTLVPSLFREMSELLACGMIGPLPVTEFSDPKDAFRFMAQARHVGKIVVSRTDTGTSPGQWRIDPAATYLISGGCGALGLLFAARFAEQGARRLILLSRTGASAKATAAIDALRLQGVEITVAHVDVSDPSAVESVLRDIPSANPLKGVLHAAGTLDDHSLLEQSPASVRETMGPKWQGGWVLHELTRSMELDFFVLFSSASALLGSPGQANYAMGNAMLDGLAQYRREEGLPGLSIQWGPWNSPGMSEQMKIDPASIGLGLIEPRDGFAMMETLMREGPTVAAVLPILSWRRFTRERPLSRSSLLSLLVNTEHEDRRTKEPNDEQQVTFNVMLGRAKVSERRELLREHLRQRVVQILSLGVHTRIDEDEALHDLGLDSLMAVELRNALVASLNRRLSPTLLLDYPTLRRLTDFLLTAIFDDQDSAADKEAINSIEALSESEAETLLFEELGRRDDAATR